MNVGFFSTKILFIIEVFSKILYNDHSHYIINSILINLENIDSFLVKIEKEAQTVLRGEGIMKKFCKILSLILVFSLIFIALPIQNPISVGQVYASAENSIRYPQSEVEFSPDMDLMTMSGTIYSDSEIVAQDKIWLTGDLVFEANDFEVYEFGDGSILYYNITDNLILPLEGENGSTITWDSSDESVIETNGTVHRPKYSEGNKDVILTATLVSGEEKIVKTFSIEVNSLEPTSDEVSVKADYDWLTGDVIHYGSYSDNIVSNMKLPKEGNNGSIISWVSSAPEWINTDGKVTQPPFSYALDSVTVTLTATISKGTVSREKIFELEVRPLTPNVSDYVPYVMSKLTDDRILNGNSRDDVKRRLNLPTEYKNQFWRDMKIGDCTISWQSSEPDVITSDGTVTRPAKGQESVPVTLTATVLYEGYGENISDTKDFELIVTPTEEYPLAINYNHFSDISRLQLSGEAVVVDTTDRKGNTISGLQLKNRDEVLGASVFTKNRIWLGEDMSFSTSFTFRHNPETIDSKGITFALKTSAAEQGLRINLITPSESYMYAEVYYNGDNLYSSGSQSIYLPSWCTVWIEYDGASKVLEVRCSNEDLMYGSSNVMFKFEDLDLGKLFVSTGTGSSTDAGEVYAGFIQEKEGTTEIMNWYLKNDAVPIEFGPHIFTDLSNNTISADPQAGSASSIVTLSVKDNGGSVSGVIIGFTTSFGTLDSLSDSLIKITNEEGQASVSLSALQTGTAVVKAIAPGGAIATIEVYLALSDEDRMTYDRNWLSEELVLDGNSDPDNIVKNLYLPIVGPSGSNIFWSSNNNHVNVTDGTVILPSAEEGDQEIMLTASISVGSETREKIFNITINVPDESLAAYDRDWLTIDEILGDNTSFDNITGDLELDFVGPKGSAISWNSSNEELVTPDGKVTRPEFIQGDKEFILTATIKYGGIELEKSFTLKVKAVGPTDAEAVNADSAWLTEGEILNGNSSAGSITKNLNLPETGRNGSSISWKSSNENFIKADGTVNRPPFSHGEKTVTLTATIKKGDESVLRTFLFTVRTVEPTDAEVVVADKEWLNIHRTLDQNLSPYAIIESLSLPDKAPKGSDITWASDTPVTISNTGAVVRPEYTEGHKTVTLTATLTKGSVSESKTFTYTVLAIPDIEPPKITGTTPAENSTGVLWDTKEIIISFDEEIKPGKKAASGAYDFGCVLQAKNTTTISARIDGKNLIITPMVDMAAGQNKLIVPEGAVTDISGNPSNYFELIFDVEKKLMQKLEVIDSNPQDREKEVSTDIKEISLSFNYGALNKSRKFTNISLRTSAGKVVSTTPVLSDDKVTLSLNGTSLLPGTVYEIYIPSYAVQDRFFNENTEKIIRFRTRDTYEKPAITGTYPQNKQTGVSISQSIEVYFSKPIKAEDCKLTLTDSWGFKVSMTIKNVDDSNRSVLIIPMIELRENHQYTLSGIYDSVENPSDLEFTLRFETGKNALDIRSTSPNYYSYKPDSPINQPVEITYSSAITQGSAFDDIKLLNSQGHPVAFQAEIRDNKAILMPSSDFEPTDIYSVHFPDGAFVNEKGEINDTFRFKFTTAAKLEPDTDILNFPSIWFINKSLTFDASIVEAAFKSAKYEIVSYEWNFGDGSSASGKSAVHTFSQTGDYTVVLSVKDNKGFSYEFSRTLTVEEKLLENLSIKVSRNGGNVLSIANSVPTLTYRVKLDYEGQNIPGESIKVQLYKSGILQRDYGTITSGNGDSAYVFTFTPSTLYHGTYELVFTYESKNEIIAAREPVSIQGFNLTGPFRIRLFDHKTYSGQPFEEADYLDIVINGVKKTALKEWQSDEGCYAYVVNEKFNVGEAYIIQIKGWTLDDERITVGGLVYPPKIVRGFVSRPGLNNVTMESVEFRGRPAFIEGVDVGPATFRLDGYWDIFEPGYYEFKTDSDRVNIKSSNPEFTFNPGKDFRGGERLMFRMVSKEGFRSHWFYASALVLPRPSIGITKGLDISFVDGIYCLSAPAALNSVIGGTISLLDSVPLLSGGNFGFSNDIPRFIGEIGPNPYKLKFNFSGGASYGETTSTESKVKKLKKVVSAGYEVGAQIEGRLELDYDNNEKDWELYYALINMNAYGNYTWTRGYKIPVIDVGIETQLKMGVSVKTSLEIDQSGSNAKVYSGIIRITPNATASIVFGADWVNVTGYLDAYIPAEIHIPTGYIEAELDVDTRIIGNFFTYSKPLYEKNLVSVHWDNGKPKVSIKRAMNNTDEGEASDAENSGFQPMLRNYLDRESVWMVGSQKGMNGLLRAAGSEANPQTSVMMENIYPEAAAELVQNGDELWLVWIDDNPERSDSNRTQLKYSILKDGSWTYPEWIGQDGTADFSPAMASTGDGMLLAWQNIKQADSVEDGLGGLIQNSEITVTESVYTSETGSPNLITLTNDDKFDHSPRLAANSDNALLVWTKSEGLSFTLGSDTDKYRAPKNSDSLYFSIWNGYAWSEPSEIEGSLPVVLDTNLSVSGEEGLLLYVLDMDSDLSTMEDREVFARIYKGGTWGEAVRLTNNQTNDSGPAAVHINGKWFITWSQNGNIMYKNGLNGEIITGEFLQNVPGDYELAVMNSSNPQVALVYKKPGEDGMNRMAAFFYDIENGVWSGDITLGEAEGYIKAIATVFTQDGKLNVAHTRAQVITEVIDGVERKNISNKVDLCMLTYSPIHNIGFDEEYGLMLSKEIPLPDTVTTAFVKVDNNGDYAESAVVYLYEGHPEAGGVLVGTTEVEEAIPARSSVLAGIEWLVGPEEKAAYDLYAVIRSDGVNEINPEKKMLNLKILTADAAITDLKVKNIAWDDYLVKATLVNKGSKTLKGIKAQLEHVLSAQVLDTIPVQELIPGEEVIVEFFISSSNLDKDENGRTIIDLRVVVPEEVKENSVENNILQFELEPESIIVTGTNPGQGDSQVGIHDAITLYFNMKVEEGTGFEQIILEDEDLNIIATRKILDGDMLTITPLEDLKFNTRYTLTIPADALGDSYGHTLDEEYSMSFTTTLESPEVIFAYPGEGMNSIPLNADIRLKINQRAAKGPTFDDIAIYGPDQKKIPVTTSINNEWIYIQPTGSLNINTAYTLVAPMGSVINDKGEAQQEEYSLTFTTVGSADVPEEPGDSHSTPTTSPGQNSNPIDTVSAASITIKASSDNLGNATATITAWQIKTAIDQQQENGNKLIIQVEMQDVANSVDIVLTSDALVELKSGQIRHLTVVTPFASVVFDEKSLSSLLAEAGENLTLTISRVDVSTLPEDILKQVGSRPVFDFTVKASGKTIPQFTGTVTVALPYTPADDEDTNAIVVYYINSEDELEIVTNGYYQTASGTVIFTTNHFSTYAVGYNKLSFNDVVANAWYKNAVSFIAARGITAGTGNNNYSPEVILTRSQFIVMLMRAYNIAPDIEPTNNFADAGNTYYTNYLSAAKRLGISAGVGNNLFAPDRAINRQEMFAMLYNALKVIGKLPESGSNKKLTDFYDNGSVASWAKEAMDHLVKAGMINGSSGKLAPTEIANRAQMAQILYNLMTR